MMTTEPARSYTKLAIAIVVGAVILSAAIFASPALYPAKTITLTNTSTYTSAQTVTLLATVFSTSCDYVIPGTCPTGQAFPLSVNYSGPWAVMYEGYNEACGLNCNSSTLQTLSGSYYGSGFDSRNITVGGQGNGWTLCVQAQKLDGSNSALILDREQAETSLPFGTASTCSEAELV